MGEVGWDDQSELYDALMRKATILLRDDAVMAEKVVRSSLTALRNAAEQGRSLPPNWLDQAVVDRTRSILRHRGQPPRIPE